MRAIFLLFIVLALGCGSRPVPVAAPEQRVQEIVQRANGNWDALSESDRKVLIEELGRGNEMNARMSFSARTAKGGPPMPGAF